MEFDQACKGRWQTDVQHIQTKYFTAGYDMPQLVFWNLRSSISHPARCNEPGVAMLSGYSAGMMKAFLQFRLENFTPWGQMVAALTPYECLQVAAVDLS